MNTITKESQELLDEFFKEHKLFFCDDVSWKIYKKDNLETRLLYLFSKFGFSLSLVKKKTQII